MPDKIETKGQAGDNVEKIQEQQVETSEKTNDILETVVGSYPENIDNKLQGLIDIFDEKGAICTALGLNTTIESHLSVIANMTTAIAGLLFGEKGINSGDVFTKLTSKIKSAEVFTEIANEVKSDSKGGAKSSLEIIIAGLNKAGTKQLTEFLEVLKGMSPSSQVLDVSTLIQSISSLDGVIGALDTLDLSSIKDKVKNFKGMDDVFKALADIITLAETFTKNIDKFLDAEDDIKDFLSILTDIIANKKEASILQVANAVAELKGTGTLEDLDESLIIVGNALYIISEINNINVVADKKFRDNVEKLISNIIWLKDKLIELDNGDGAKLAEVANICKSLSEVFKGLMIIAISATVAGLLCAPAIVGLFLVVPLLYIIGKVIIPILAGLTTDGELKLSFDGVEQLGQLLLIITGVLLIGALFMKLGLWIETLQFGVLIITFLGAMLLVGKMVQVANAGFSGLYDFAQLILALTGCLLIGALFMMIDELWMNALLFAGILTIFVGGILVVMVLAANLGKGKTLKIGETLIKLIIVLSTALIVGALFMMIDGFATNALLFALILTGFITAILAIIVIAAKMGKSLRLADTLVQLIGVLALSLIIGALFMFIPKFPEKSLEFVGLMLLYVGGIMLIFTIASKFMKSALKEMIMLAIITVVMTATLLIGASFMEDGGFGNAMLFITSMIIYVGVFMGFGAALAACAAFIAPGLLALGGIALVSMAIAAAIDIAVDVWKKVGDFKTLLEAVGSMMAVVLTIGFGCIAAIPLIPIILIASVGLVPLAVVITLLGGALAAVGAAMEAGVKSSHLSSFFNSVNSLIEGIDEIDIGIKFLFKIGKISDACIPMARMISTLALAVSNISNLKIATGYDKDGKATGYDKLTEKDFSNAATNVSTIITTLGAALAETYDKNKNLFSSWRVLLVIEACTRMGRMISGIARGVADLAGAKVATKWDKDGNPIAYEKLDLNKDVVDMAINLGIIICAMGAALKFVYEKNKDMFTTNYFTGDTPATRVINTCTKMGEMISSITKGVVDLAGGRIATKWDPKTNEPTEWINIGEVKQEDIYKVLSNVLTASVSALGQIYIDNFAEIMAVDLWGENLINATTNIGKIFEELIKATKPLLDNKDIVSGEGTKQCITASIMFATSVVRLANAYDENEWAVDKLKHWADKYIIPATQNVGKIYNALINSIKPIIDNKNVISPEAIIQCTVASTLFVTSVVSLAKLYDEYGWAVDSLSRWTDKYIVPATEDAGKIYIELIKSVKPLKDNMGIIANGIALTNMASALLNLMFVNFSSPLLVRNLLTATSTIQSIGLTFGTKEWKTLLKNCILIPKSFNKLSELDPASLDVFKTFLTNLSVLDTIDFLSVTKFNNIAKGSKDIIPLIKLVNNLDTEKTDKFIQLAYALGFLAEKMDEMDGKMFKVLYYLSEKIGDASKIIERSDDMQEKRIKTIKEQAKEISKLIDKPMTVEFKPEEKIEYGSLLKSSIFGKDKEEDTKNKNIPAPQLNNNTSNNQGSSPELVSIAGTASEIQSLLYQILQQRG
jgi:hypothetical protein